MRILFGLLLFPFAVSLVWNIFLMVVTLGDRATDSVLPLFGGIVSYFIFQAILFRPVRTYVFGHELTHAVAGLMSGAKLKGFKVTSNGGSVTLTKTNVWITLAPYFVPIYTVIAVILYKILSRFYPVDGYYWIFLFSVGFTLSFHFGLTNYAISQGQSDLKRFGRFFSGVFILVVTCLVMAVLLKIVFPNNINIKGYFKASLVDTWKIWIHLKLWANELWLFFRKTK
jgi:hypothetical protein